MRMVMFGCWLFQQASLVKNMTANVKVLRDKLWIQSGSESNHPVSLFPRSRGWKKTHITAILRDKPSFLSQGFQHFGKRLVQILISSKPNKRWQYIPRLWQTLQRWWPVSQSGSENAWAAGVLSFCTPPFPSISFLLMKGSSLFLSVYLTLQLFAVGVS